MRILLVGEYSRLHNSLKEGLLKLGHEVKIVSNGDDFKNYESDSSVKSVLFSKYWLAKKFKNGLKKTLRFDLEKTERSIRLYFILSKLKGFDAIQLINSDALELNPKVSLYFYKKLIVYNKNVSLLVCGEDTPIIEHFLKNEVKYSILSPLIKNHSLKKHYNFSLKYLQKNYTSVFSWLANNVNQIIVSDLDYNLPMKAMNYDVQFIPNPINTDLINFAEIETTEKIIIFLGINRLSYVKKGIPFFEEAVKIIQQKYTSKVEINITENIPYKEYIQLYNRAHIVLDMVYAYDQGYNALEAMAKGKVVFTGAEKEFMEYYHLTERVCVNALPDVDSLVQELSFLIENPDEIVAISKRARAFIEKEHHYVTIAQKYIDVWTKN